MVHDKAVFQEIHGRLLQWLGSGGIELDTYHLGLHVLQRMQKYKSLEIAASWGEFQRETLTSAGHVIAPPAQPGRYHFYGALQQLQEYIGVFSHISQPGLEEVLEAAHSGDGVSPHFTKEPGVCSHIIGEKTLIVFAYRSWAGYSADIYSESLLEQTKATRLPAWLHKTPGRRKG